MRAELLGRPEIALRMMVAHVMAGSSLWRVSVEPRATHNEAIADSSESSLAEAEFDAVRRTLLGRIGRDEHHATLTDYAYDSRTVALFLRLIALPDTDVMAILSVVMGETLSVGGVIVEALGAHLGTDMARWWQADDAFFDTLRDREVMTAILSEVAGDTIARANAKEKGKTVKAIVRAHLDGSDGRTRVEHWVPRWMRFAPSAYTARGAVGTVTAAATVRTISAGLDAQPLADVDGMAAPFIEPEPDASRLAA